MKCDFEILIFPSKYLSKADKENVSKLYQYVKNIKEQELK